MKRLALVLAGLGLAALLVLVILVVTFDPNAYREDIADRLSAALGREVRLLGDVTLRPSLTPALVVEGLSVANTDWASHANLLEVARFEARVRLAALLRRRLDVVRLAVDGATLHLERNDDAVNWNLGTANKASADASGSTGPVALNVDQISVRDLVVHYRDADAKPLRLDAERAELLPNGYGQPLRLRARLRLNDRPLHVGALIAPLSKLFANEPYDIDLRLTMDEARLELLGQVAQPLDASGIALDVTAAAPARSFGPSISRRVPARAQLAVTARLRDDDADLLLEDIVASFDDSTVTGSARLATNGPRPFITADLRSDVLDLTPFEGEPAEPEPGARVFSPAPLALDILRALDFKLGAHVGELRLPPANLSSVILTATLDDAVLRVGRLSGALIDGTVDATLRLDASGDEARLEHRLTLKDLPASALFSGKAAQAVRGGRVDLALDVSARGVSAATLAGSSNGHVSAFVRDADLSNDAANAASSDVALSLLQSFNPLSKDDPTTRLECAVFNFPIDDGVLESSQGIGIMTSKLSVLGGGTINLGAETLLLRLSPKPREGIGLSLAGLADFIQLGGTLRNPRPVTDAKGAAVAGLKVGAAVATAGLSVLAEGALDRADGDRDVCAIARGDIPADSDGNKPVISRAAESAGDTLKKAGGAIRDTFRGLFD